MACPERRIGLTGESPVRVSAGAPGSRLRSRGEIRAARRSVESPCKRGEQTNGLQQSVNANSLDKLSAERCLGEPSFSCHSEGNRQRSGPERMLDSPRGLRRRHDGKEQCGTGETLPGSQEKPRTRRALRNRWPITRIGRVCFSDY